MTKRQSKENRKLLDKRLMREDEDRWLSSRYAPVAKRERLVALYGLNLELAKVRIVVSEPGLGAIRFQWWRDAIAEIAEQKSPRKHDVVQAVADANLNTRTCMDLIAGHEVAFDQNDRALEPEALLMRAAAALLLPTHGWGENFDGLASAYAAARRGDSRSVGPIVPKVPTPMRPAISHAVLRFRYAQGKPPGPLRKRVAIAGAMLSGRA